MTPFNSCEGLTPLSMCFLPQHETNVLDDQVIRALPQDPQPGTPTLPSSDRGQSNRPSTSNAPSGQLETQDPINQLMDLAFGVFNDRVEKAKRIQGQSK